MHKQGKVYGVTIFALLHLQTLSSHFEFAQSKYIICIVIDTPVRVCLLFNTKKLEFFPHKNLPTDN